MTHKAPPQIWLHVRPDGSCGLVDENNKPIPDDRRYTTTATELGQTMAYYRDLGIEMGKTLGVDPVFVVDLIGMAREGSLKAGVQGGYVAGVKAGAQAGAKAGVKAGAQYVVNNSRVRRTVERDSEGRIMGSIEDRVFEQPTPPAAEKVIGFRPPAKAAP